MGPKRGGSRPPRPGTVPIPSTPRRAPATISTDRRDDRRRRAKSAIVPRASTIWTSKRIGQEGARAPSRRRRNDHRCRRRRRRRRVCGCASRYETDGTVGGGA